MNSIDYKTRLYKKQGTGVFLASCLLVSSLSISTVYTSPLF